MRNMQIFIDIWPSVREYKQNDYNGKSWYNRFEDKPVSNQTITIKTKKW